MCDTGTMNKYIPPHRRGIEQSPSEIDCNDHKSKEHKHNRSKRNGKKSNTVPATCCAKCIDSKVVFKRRIHRSAKYKLEYGCFHCVWVKHTDCKYPPHLSHVVHMETPPVYIDKHITTYINGAYKYCFSVLANDHNCHDILNHLRHTVHMCEELYKLFKITSVGIQLCSYYTKKHGKDHLHSWIRVNPPSHDIYNSTFKMTDGWRENTVDRRERSNTHRSGDEHGSLSRKDIDVFLDNDICVSAERMGILDLLESDDIYIFLDDIVIGPCGVSIGSVSMSRSNGCP